MMINSDCGKDITAICKLVIEIHESISLALIKNFTAAVDEPEIKINYDALQPVDSFGISICLKAKDKKSFSIIQNLFSKWVQNTFYPFEMPSIESHQDTIGLYEISTGENEIILLFGFVNGDL